MNNSLVEVIGNTVNTTKDAFGKTSGKRIVCVLLADQDVALALKPKYLRLPSKEEKRQQIRQIIENQKLGRRKSNTRETQAGGTFM